MKVKIINTLAFLLLVTWVVQAQSADEILKKHFAATGQDKIKDIQTITMSMSMNNSGMVIPMTSIMKKPHSMYLEMTMQGQKMQIGFDGKKGWMINPMMGGSPIEIPQEQVNQFNKQSSFEQLGLFADYKEQGHTVSYLGKENVNDKPAHKVKLLKKDGDQITMFIDVTNHMMVKQLIKTKSMGKEIEAESYLSDYKKVGNFTLPHKIEIKAADTPTTTVTISKIEFNKAIDDSKFKMPAK